MLPHGDLLTTHQAQTCTLTQRRTSQHKTKRANTKRRNKHHIQDNTTHRTTTHYSTASSIHHTTYSTHYLADRVQSACTRVRECWLACSNLCVRGQNTRHWLHIHATAMTSDSCELRPFFTRASHDESLQGDVCYYRSCNCATSTGQTLFLIASP